jgi:hypothetical protein
MEQNRTKALGKAYTVPVAGRKFGRLRESGANTSEVRRNNGN